MSVTLIWQGSDAPASAWPGTVIPVPDPTPAALHSLLAEHLPDSDAAAWLFWDAALGMPDPDQIHRLLQRPHDCWHAGLQLGQAGRPGIMDFLRPTWMLNRDPSPDIEATSWRLSLRACLVRTSVLQQMGGPHPAFRSRAGAALEMGHRYVTRGVFVRHVSDLVLEATPGAGEPIFLADEIRFARYRFGNLWARWALYRMARTGYGRLRALWRAWRHVRRESCPPEPPPFERTMPSADTAQVQAARVTVLIPTLERYPYLRTLLGQFRAQTLPPLEIILVDQTPQADRDETLVVDFADLPLRILYQDEPGQCSSRNAGLQAARGDFILFLDDDDEIPPVLIEQHVHRLFALEADVSSGVAEEVGAGPLPEAFRLLRSSDVFPTNNTLIRREILERSGLFDHAYDHGPRADADLGMRLYLSGAFMVLSPDISVLHHHAPRGGLRKHGARAVTRASSRKQLLHRHLPAVTEIYLAKRYFSERQVREALCLRATGTLRGEGSWGRQFIKTILGILFFPDTLRQIRQHVIEAEHVLEAYPQGPAQMQRTTLSDTYAG